MARAHTIEELRIAPGRATGQDVQMLLDRIDALEGVLRRVSTTCVRYTYEGDYVYCTPEDRCVPCRVKAVLALSQKDQQERECP